MRPTFSIEPQGINSLPSPIVWKPGVAGAADRARSTSTPPTVNHIHGSTFSSACWQPAALATSRSPVASITLRAFTAKRDFALERLAAMGLTDVAPCGGAFYLFVNLERLPEPLRDGMAFFEAALAAKVICVPGTFFDVDPGKRREHLPSRLQHFARLSFGPSMSELATGLDRLEAVIDAVR